MTTAQTLLFLAVLVQVLMTLFLYTRLLRARMVSARSGAADLNRIAYNSSGWPEKARVIANSVTSQFELPVLFYVAVALTFTLGAVNWITVIVAWLFVIARLIHMAIHTGSNTVMPRLRAFLVGFAIVLVYWLYLAFHVITGWLLLA